MYHFHLHLLSFLYNKMQGVANRGCSIRVGRDTEKQGKGISLFRALQNQNQ